MSSTETTTPAQATPTTVESAVEHAKRAFALKKYEQAVQFYATALELAVEKQGDQSTETADLYFAYGKALLENAISQNSVLGKEQPENAPEEEANNAASSSNGPILSFSGDAEDEDEAVDLANLAQGEEEGNEDEEEEEENDEPEDDFNAAWEVLDLARTIYERQTDESFKPKLAEVYITLGDVSLETEKFDQAILDYQASLDLKTELLPLSSREIAEAHYKLSIALDLTSGRLSDSIFHAQKALDSVDARIDELTKAEPGTSAEKDEKGKGKANAASGMTAAQIEAEIKELKELREDLALKVEELKTTPNENTKASAPALAAQALDQELKASGPSTKDLPVNDLTTMVKKKKKVTEPQAANTESSSSKRKAEDEVSPEAGPKRTKSEGAE